MVRMFGLPSVIDVKLGFYTFQTMVLVNLLSQRGVNLIAESSELLSGYGVSFYNLLSHRGVNLIVETSGHAYCSAIKPDKTL